MKHLPVQYHYEFYTSHLDSHPFYSFKTTTPLGSFSLGDFLDWRGLKDFPLQVAPGSRVRIADVEHIFWEIENDHVGHKTMISVEIFKD